MELQAIRIEKIKPYEKNPRINDKSIEKVAQSIEEFGFKQPIVLDKNMVIIVGHTRYMAAKKLGYKEVPCVIASDLNDKQVRAYRLADNKVADFSVWDNKLLLEELDGIGFDIFTGFDVSDIFCDVMDESDNSVLDENEDGVVYEIKLVSSNRDKIEKVREFFEGFADV